MVMRALIGIAVLLALAGGLIMLLSFGADYFEYRMDLIESMLVDRM